MNISTKAMISNSEIIKNFKACRDKAEIFGKLFILKNNQPDSVLFSIGEYERLSVFIEYMESLEEKDIAKVVKALDYLKKESKLTNSIDEIKPNS